MGNFLVGLGGRWGFAKPPGAVTAEEQPLTLCSPRPTLNCETTKLRHTRKSKFIIRR